MRKSVIGGVAAAVLVVLVSMAFQIPSSSEDVTAVMPLQVEPELRETIVTSPGETRSVDILIHNSELADLRYEAEILKNMPPSEPEIAGGLAIEKAQNGSIFAAAITTASLTIHAEDSVETGTYFLHLEVFDSNENRSSGWYFPIDIV